MIHFIFIEVGQKAGVGIFPQHEVDGGTIDLMKLRFFVGMVWLGNPLIGVGGHLICVNTKCILRVNYK